MSKLQRCLFALFCVTSTQVNAHSFHDMTLPMEGLHLHLNASGAYRSEALVKANERWVIPGVMLGGEAFPASAGLSLDEVFLSPIYRQDASYVALKIGKHLGGESVELDHALIGHQWSPALAFEAGQMASIISPFNGEHVTDTSFSSRRLVTDAFWGGQLNDQGVRIKASHFGFDYGLELWKGSSFPAAQKNTNKAAGDIYLRYTYKNEISRFLLGAYAYQGTAEAREDDRYTASHSHSTSLITTDPTYFDGKIKSWGALGSAQLSWSEVWQVGLQGEAVRQEQDGRVWDAARQADIETEGLGLWAEAWLARGPDRLVGRSERLQLKNDLYGPAASSLAGRLNLLGVSSDPYRHTLGYERTLNRYVRTRLEWSRDFTSGRRLEIYTLSAVWNDMIMHLPL